MGPHEHTRSTYSRPSTSVRYGPLALAMNRGVPPTTRKARTGLLTPPGVTATARVSNAWEAGASCGYGVWGVVMRTIISVPGHSATSGRGPARAHDHAFLRRAVPQLPVYQRTVPCSGSRC